MSYHETKFKTIDGIEIHAHVYPAAEMGPGVVMCPGFKCVLTMLNLPECASELQKQGITALLYDPRNTGYSGGQPREDIDPPQSVADMSDALTHLLTLPNVDAAQAGLFGISFGGAIALTAAAVDPRACFTIAVAPVTDFDFTSPAQRVQVLRKCMRDRESQILGNPPFIIPLLNERGENAAGLGHGIDTKRYERLIRDNREIAPGHVNRVTLMSYYKIAMWTPWPLWSHLGSGYEEGKGRKTQSSSVLWLIPGKDEVSHVETQRQFYEELGGSNGCKKRKIEIEGAEHERVLGEEYLDTVINGIVGFVKDTVNNNL